MPKLKSTKERVLITIDKDLLKLIKQQNKKVSTLINDVLQMYLLNQYNQQLNELLMLNACFWKSCPLWDCGFKSHPWRFVILLTYFFQHFATFCATFSKG
jgi:hypothetical protein